MSACFGPEEPIPPPLLAQHDAQHDSRWTISRSLYGGLIHLLLPPALPSLLQPEAGPIYLLPVGWTRGYWLGGNWVKNLTVQGPLPSQVCAATARATPLGLDWALSAEWARPAAGAHPHPATAMACSRLPETA